MPVVSDFEKEPNILSEQQEEWLGEVMAPQLEEEFHTIPDPESDYLQKLGDRLVAVLPPSKIHYRFTIIDLPETNSFGMPGGHIYISRKLIAFIQNEDELAGVLGHEIGHIITRQAAIDISRALRELLRVSQLGDRQDVVNRWNQLLDTYATKKSVAHGEKRAEAEQGVADRIALYAMSRAGYQPSRYVEFYDRFAQTKGNIGNFWSDLFGRTSRDSKRLRELLRTTEPLRQSCVVSAAKGTPEFFMKWQNAVVGSNFSSVKEALPGLLFKGSLNPPLRSDLRFLQFSPDGAFLLAQDENSIFVLKANPTSLLFSVEAPDSELAHFTPDSTGLVFYDKEFRVQKWNIQTQQRISVHALVLQRSCLQSALSPSGEVMACLTHDLEPILLDVNDNSVIFQGKRLHEPTIAEAWSWVVTLSLGGRPQFAGLQFSPDDKYFLAAHGGSVVCYDLKAKKECSVPQRAKELISASFIFLAADQIASYSIRNSNVVLLRATFPSGEVLDSVPWSLGGRLIPAGKGDYVLLGQGPAGRTHLLDWKAKKSILVSKTPAFAVYGDVFAGETKGGEIGIYKVSDRAYQSGIELPAGPLGSTLAAAFSPDGQWLAISERSRGAMWNISTGERTFLTRGFEGAYFNKDQMFAKFPQQDDQQAGVFKLDPATKISEKAYALSGTTPGPSSFLVRLDQLGEVLVKSSLEADNKAGSNLLEAFDVQTNQKLWQRDLQKRTPGIYYSKSGHTLTLVVANYRDMKEEAKKYDDLRARLAELGNESRRAASYIVEVLDLSNGKDLGQVLVDTGNLSFKVLAAFAVSDTLLVNDSLNRTLVYSLGSGTQRGKVFGNARAVSADGRRIFIENVKGRVDLYDVGSLQSPLIHFDFPSSITHAEFSTDQSSILVLTSDQTIYRVKLPAVATATPH